MAGAVVARVVGGAVLFTLIGGGSTAVAQDAAGAASPITVRWNVEVIGAGRLVSPTDAPFNPGNGVLRIPEAMGMLEVRGNLRVEVGSRFSLIVRPRLLGSIERVVPAGAPSAVRRETDAQFAEAFATWRPVDAVAVSYGLQNFQWGPAELLSPSNRVFHETGLFRDPLYSVRGKHLLRTNVSVGRQWSLIALAELSHNGAGADEAFRAETPFARHGVVKLEFTSAGGGTYAGLSGGAVEGARPWVGEYGTWMLSDAIALYIDASHTRGSGAWYPSLAGGRRPVFSTTLDAGDTWKTMAVAGLRYTFARGDELRLEYFHQDAGYSDAQIADAVTTLLVAPDPSSYRRFLAPGLEFVGRNLGLVSLRLPDLPPTKRTNVQLRYLGSMTDGSGVVFGNATVNATDAMVAFTTVALTHGASYAEFSRVARTSITAGVVYSF